MDLLVLIYGLGGGDHGHAPPPGGDRPGGHVGLVYGHHGHELLLLADVNSVVLAFILNHGFECPNGHELVEGVHQEADDALGQVVPAQILFDLSNAKDHAAVTVNDRNFFITCVFLRIDMRKSHINDICLYNL